MKYCSFSLENFKGIEKVNIDFDLLSSPLALVGLNESGKTTIFNGIDFIGRHCQELSDGKITTPLKNGELQKIKPKKSFFSNSIKLSCIILDTNQERKSIDFIYNFESDNFKDYLIQIDDKIVNEGKEEEHPSLFNTFKDLPDILYYDDFIFEIPKEIKYYKDSNYMDKHQTDTNRQWQDILDDIVKSLRKDKESTFQKNYVNFYLKDPIGNESAFNDNLLGLSNHITKKIVTKWKKVLKSNSALKEIDIQMSTNQKEYLSVSLRVKSKQNKYFELSQRSKGCQWFFSFMLFTEFRKNRKDNTVFLLDEPASNIHASAQEKIMESINNLSKESTVLYSTHSPYLIDINNEKSIYIVKNLNSNSEVKDPKIEISLIKDFSSDEEYLRPLLDHILFRYPPLFLPKEQDKKTITPKNTIGISKLRSFLQTLQKKLKEGSFYMVYINTLIKYYDDK